MHESVMSFCRSVLNEDCINGFRVLEVGSLNVNGSVRDIVTRFSPKKYVGVDIRDGVGVDRVVSASDLIHEFGYLSFDVVISTEMLEHCQDWREAIHNMKHVLSDNGLLLVTTRGPGFPFHEYPGDYWRFTVEDFTKIFSDFKSVMIRSDEQAPGVFFFGRKDSRNSHMDLDRIEVSSVA